MIKKIIIYFKNIIRKKNKYIEDKRRRKYKKLEIIILKNIISSNISINVKSYGETTKKNYLLNNQISFTKIKLETN